jgi:hypothetical protein
MFEAIEEFFGDPGASIEVSFINLDATSPKNGLRVAMDLKLLQEKAIVFLWAVISFETGLIESGLLPALPSL